MTEESALAHVAARAGVAPAYRDAWGNEHRVPEATQRALLAAMGFEVADAAGLEAARAALEDEPWRRPLEPVQVVRRGRDPIRVPLTLPAAAGEQTVEWRLEEEGGEIRSGRAVFGALAPMDSHRLDGLVVERRALELPADVALGYHTLHALDRRMLLIVAPPHAHLPAGDRLWGISVQLYGVHSARSWGIGDFGDLARLATVAAGLGADALGLNPLHAMFPGDPRRFSPYSPSDRRFLAVPYIDVEAVADFTECEDAQALVRSPDFRARIEAARAAPLVDYADVGPAKLHVLNLLYRSFRKTHLGPPPSARGAAFRHYQAAGGDALRRFATFQALSEHFGPERTWHAWPAEYQDAESGEVAAFARQNFERVEFFEYLQWQAEQQLDDAARAAAQAGMSVGLYHDLALGADADGAETWVHRRLMAHGVRVGAPPDDWNLKGQNWGLPAYNPIALRAAAYAPFVEMLRANMRHGGAVRIDHVMSLQRLFWIPQGATATDGGYVAYPVDDLMGILALESVRHDCVVVGEDLGTLPDGFQDRMRESAVLSSRLLYFAQDGGGEFLAPKDYPAPALVEIGTHDLATLPGYWRDRDLELRHELNLYPSPESEAQARARRVHERAALVRALKREEILPADAPEGADAIQNGLAEAAYRFLARTPARLLLMHPEDALGVEAQANLPGTVDEHPNWRRKLPQGIEALADDPRLRAVAAAIVAERGRR